MVSTQARGSPPLNPRMFLKARIEASCTISSASARLPAIQREPEGIDEVRQDHVGKAGLITRVVHIWAG
jgi:hypothetical protein